MVASIYPSHGWIPSRAMANETSFFFFLVTCEVCMGAPSSPLVCIKLVTLILIWEPPYVLWQKTLKKNPLASVFSSTNLMWDFSPILENQTTTVQEKKQMGKFSMPYCTVLKHIQTQHSQTSFTLTKRKLTHMNFTLTNKFKDECWILTIGI